MKLASSNDIQAAVILHPGPLTIDEIRGNIRFFPRFFVIMK